MTGKKLNENLDTFLRHIESIKDTLPMTLLLLGPHQQKAQDKLVQFMNENVEEIEKEDGEKAIAVKYEEAKIFEQLSKNSEISILASKIIPESLFVSLISQFDAYLNRLLRILFEIRPEFINQSDRNLAFSDLIGFDSIEQAREHIIEKEVECVLRKSHSEHFDYLETKLNMPLRKKLPVWSKYIEITERRNLFVHCDGIVSSQYLKVCQQHKSDVHDIQLNQRLDVSLEYFDKAYKSLFELAVKLTHTIWRKLLKNDFKGADRHLNDICYDLMSSGQFYLADIMLEFACEQNKFYNDAYKNVFIVNRALSKYLQDKKDDAQNIINQKDWSASSDDFKLSKFVLNEEFEDCYALMKKIGKDGEVDKENYRTWPLFYKLRKEEGFKVTFKEIFNEEYKVVEIPKRPVQEIIEKEIENNPELQDKVKNKEMSKKQLKEKEELGKEEELRPTMAHKA
ncbi:hypothetical protein [Carboxylicivirga marina]|uniref:Uncharacterized protein n=1 Tax=Carboxylicivirga marina TaxID=2800988 RepID=A0ABS1HQL4_9BACT|nr:hypothetical protein [Carboxylicivirga marina]MBK3519977.1 hypothetical protein [Carboxylicivirga marina]